MVAYGRRSEQSMKDLFLQQDVDLSNVSFVRGELDSIEDIAEALKGCNGVFHLAGVVVHSRSGGLPANEQSDYPSSLFRTNVDFSVNVVLAAARAK